MCENKRIVGAAWCGMCYENLRGRANHRGHLRCRRKRTSSHDDERMALSKPAGDGGHHLRRGPGDAGVTPALWPKLFEYVTLETWDDGSPRVTSSVLVFFEGGLFKVCLNDRALGRTAWATGITPEDALQSLENAIAGDVVEWRKSKAAPGRR